MEIAEKQAASDWEATLRQAVESSGLTRYAICQAAKVCQSQLSRFMAGECGLSFKTAAKIGQIVGVELARRQ
jgi:hypothetical protein